MKILGVEMDAKTIKQSPEYQAYHAKVVNACCALMGEQHRYFWDKECDYLESFAENRDPDEVAQDQYDALT